MLFQCMFAALTPALAIGAAAERGRKRSGDQNDFHPLSMSKVVIGTCFIWFGSFGFNGGSALAANMRAAMACLSVLDFCSDAVAGLLAITPASGFVSPTSTVAIGFLGPVVCNMAVRLKHRLKYDDAFDVFAVHALVLLSEAF
ncbi:hypothetical protein BGZ83_000972 [Gryganskiella cystojenkinii]|nr:hypothetical protein BGZ83_000972 [Gryganskiella cystojenkinii]